MGSFLGERCQIKFNDLSLIIVDAVYLIEAIQIKFRQPMQPFELSPSREAIMNRYSNLHNKSIKLREAELPLLQSIIHHPAFAKIAPTFSQIESYFGKKLTTADPNLIELKLLEMSANKEEDDRLESKLKAGIEKLQEIIDQIDEYNSIAMEKFNWLEEEITKYEDQLDDMREEIEIISSKTQKNTHKQHPAPTASEDQELKQILQFYKCNEKPFPRNKTEALMLINRIESMIQQLEMKRLTAYSLEYSQQQ